MAFKFRYEAVLKQRRIERDIAQKEFAEAEYLVREQVAYIDSLYNAIDEARETALSKGGRLDLKELGSTEEFIKLQGIKIDQARTKARELFADMEDKQEVLMEKAKAYKMMEVLREKDLKEFKQEWLRREQIDQDEMAVMRFERRK